MIFINNKVQYYQIGIFPGLPSEFRTPIFISSKYAMAHVASSHLTMASVHNKGNRSVDLSQTKPGCQDNCGNISIPYPFGIGDDPNCFMDYDFKLICNTSSDNPVLQTQDGQPVLNISLQGQLTTSIHVAVQCQVGDSKLWNSSNTKLQLQKAYRVSNIRNIFMSVGCEMNGNLYDYMGRVRYISCDSLCLEDTQITGLPCAGLGCCQSSIPKDLSSFWVYIGNYYSFTYNGNASKCAHSVLSEQEWLSSHVFDLWTLRNNLDYLQKNRLKNLLILDWAIRNKTSCVEAQRVAADYACGSNTHCTNSTNGPGYLCHCMQGYDGNPYLPSGCQVLDWSTVNKTCEKGSTNYACGENTYCSYSKDSPGFLCHCIEGHHGDPYLPEGCQAAESTSLETKPGCQNKCGNVSIPYPFGLDGDDPTCFRDEFKLFCNTATDPPRLLMDGFLVMDISLQGQLIILSPWASIYCYTGDNQSYLYNTFIQLPNVYRFSYTRNQFTAVGCNTLGLFSDYNSSKFSLECLSSCPYDAVLTGRPRHGIGFCQIAIPKDLPAFTLRVGESAKTTNKSNSWKISRCGLAFLSDQMWFTSNASSRWNSRNDADGIVNTGIKTSVVLDWAIREKNCKEAQRANDYACGKNTNCTDSTNDPGYNCHCLNGYHGIPYLPMDAKNSYGDGRKDGQGCIAKSKAFSVIKSRKWEREVCVLRPLEISSGKDVARHRQRTDFAL
ncbi:PREDICTED: uncharacterized protein LOC104589520 [Nelumbo nucifera]|uniref:Uncharacterized protein LOC104589520 n=1 Tax=Nelumbo nucifera TaxID=4432 RepID=A0A1U7ZFA0_NELNU|nr:PREDICTED: uncharacterized protein LOC104589520 [Nelumbo nucifera]